jgi:hypothetical protein
VLGVVESLCMVHVHIENEGDLHVDDVVPGKIVPEKE